MQEQVWDYYRQQGRTMPWRESEADGSFDPYKILVSELMLQQTQVNRVLPKFNEFLQLFPNVQALAAAPLSEVLRSWSGLGYNRRAQYLHQAAKQLAMLPHFPNTVATLRELPGVGQNTAAAIMNYAYNQATPFLETNIRTVLIHFYFANQTEPVDDKQLQPLVEQTMDREHPREWFWAMMDYGAHLKATDGNYSRQSRHYTKQPKFAGSRRQIRGQIIKLLNDSVYSGRQLQERISDERLPGVLQDLLDEGLIRKAKNKYQLAD